MGVIPPGASGPENPKSRFAVGAGGADRISVEDRNQDNVTEALKVDADQDYLGSFGDFNTGLLGTLLGMFTGVAGALTGIPAAIANMMAGLFQEVDSQGSDIRDLQDTTTDLSLATGHATAYMSSSPGTTTTATRMPFTSRSGTLRGVTDLGNGQWRLDSGGEWDLSAQVEFYGGAFAPPSTYMQIVVRKPDGSVFDGITAKGSSSDTITMTNITSTMVPGPGYTVEVMAWTSEFPVLGGNWRGISGGYATTRLRIRKFEMLKDD